MLIETHAHLDYPDFANDFEDVLRRANEAGVTRIITIGTSIESSQRAVDLAEKYSNIYAVIGVHPTYAEQAEEDVMTPLREFAKSRRVVAIGETGLDYHHLPSVEAAKGKKVQVFARALQGETEEEIEANILDGAYKSKQASLFEQQLDPFKNGANVREVAAKVPFWKFMVETDCPYLAPVPFRGKRCEPAHTRIVAETIAAARSVPLQEIAEATTETAENFFRFSRS